MEQPSGEHGQNPLEQFLRQMLGDDAAAEAMHALQAQGIAPESFSQIMGSPLHMNQMIGQLKYFMNTTSGCVNWEMVRDFTRQQAYHSGDPTLSAAQAEQARQALTVADLWLDAVTDFEPGQVKRDAWSRFQWIDHTLPTWKRITEPVATNVSRALSEALTHQMRDMEDHPGVPDGVSALLGRTQEIMPKMAAMMFSTQIGQALSGLASEVLGSADVGLPLVAEGGVTALVVNNVVAFADGLDIPFDQVLQFMAVRECAHQRLFHSVPWLAHDLIHTVELYSAEIAIDTVAIAQAARDIDPSDPESMNRALSGGVFVPVPTPRQRAQLTRLETLLAMIEGWVELTTAQAVAPYLPQAQQLREMMRRRRALGGPAEQMLGHLIGLDMHPRQARGASALFHIVSAARGRKEAENLWSHPDLIPTSEDLEHPEQFLARREAAQAAEALIDDELEQMLSGTLGWAEGLSAQDDPEAESLRKAGFDVPNSRLGDSGEPKDNRLGEPLGDESGTATDNETDPGPAQRP